MTRTSGVNVATRTQTVNCSRVVMFLGKPEIFGCEFAGNVDVTYDYQTGETYWDCPKCDFPHTDLIEQP